MRSIFLLESKGKEEVKGAMAVKASYSASRSSRVRPRHRTSSHIGPTSQIVRMLSFLPGVRVLIRRHPRCAS